MQIDETILVFLSPLVVALVEIFKAMPGFRDEKWLLPLFALVLGTLGGWAWAATAGSPPLATALVSGLAAGITAITGYEVGSHALAHVLASRTPPPSPTAGDPEDSPPRLLN